MKKNKENLLKINGMIRLFRERVLDDARHHLSDKKSYLAINEEMSIKAYKSKNSSLNHFMFLVVQSDWDERDIFVILGYISVMRMLAELSDVALCKETISLGESIYSYFNPISELKVEEGDVISDINIDDDIVDFVGVFGDIDDFGQCVLTKGIEIHNMEYFYTIHDDPIHRFCNFSGMEQLETTSESYFSVICKFPRFADITYVFSKIECVRHASSDTRFTVMFRLNDRDVKQTILPIEYEGKISTLNTYLFSKELSFQSVPDDCNVDSVNSDGLIKAADLIPLLRKLGFGVGSWIYSAEEARTGELEQHISKTISDSLGFSDKAANELSESLLKNSFFFNDKSLKKIKANSVCSSLSEIVDQLSFVEWNDVDYYKRSDLEKDIYDLKDDILTSANILLKDKYFNVIESDDGLKAISTPLEACVYLNRLLLKQSDSKESAEFGSLWDFTELKRIAGFIIILELVSEHERSLIRQPLINLDKIKTAFVKRELMDDYIKYLSNKVKVDKCVGYISIDEYLTPKLEDPCKKVNLSISGMESVLALESDPVEEIFLLEGVNYIKSTSCGSVKFEVLVSKSKIPIVFSFDQGTKYHMSMSGSDIIKVSNKRVRRESFLIEKRNYLNVFRAFFREGEIN